MSHTRTPDTARGDADAPDASQDTERPRGGVRERILATADELFYRDGIRATGINAILEEARVARSSFYDHFPSKDALVVAWLETRDDDWFASFESEVRRRSATGRPRTLALFDALEVHVRGRGWRGCPFINSAAELPDESHPARQVVTAHKARLRILIERLLDADEVDRSSELADVLYLVVEGAIVAALIQGSAEPVATARRLAERLVGAVTTPLGGEGR